MILGWVLQEIKGEIKGDADLSHTLMPGVLRRERWISHLIPAVPVPSATTISRTDSRTSCVKSATGTTMTDCLPERCIDRSTGIGE